MATYDYCCIKCSLVEEHMHSMLETPEIKCSKCNSKMERKISLNIAGGFMVKGSSDSNYREKINRTKRSQAVAKKQRERYGDGKDKGVIPNIAGHETGTWENAQKVAAEIKKDTGIDPNSFTSLVKKEKQNKLIISK